MIVLVLVWIFARYPQFEPPQVLGAASVRDVDRGRYLIEQVLLCHHCHSERDFAFYAGPVIADAALGGAWVEDRVVPAFSANLTPHGLSNWTDGEVFRAITSGVNRDGDALHPLMPSDSYRNMSGADVRAVVAYLRTIPPVRRDQPAWKSRSVLEFLIVKVIGRTLPKPYEPVAVPSPDNPLAYGRYLAVIAECGFCHGSDYAGSRPVPIPGTTRTTFSSNITPDPETGIGSWSEDDFMNVFRSFRPLIENPVAARDRNTSMPWLRYASMTDQDLRALYAYLRTVPPVKRTEPLAPDATTAR
jgi:mono/diheme cytochrome c family protein